MGNLICLSSKKPNTRVEGHGSTEFYGNVPKLSPTSIKHKGVNHTVLVRTWFPSESQMHMPMPNLLLELEKEESTLHLSLPRLDYKNNIFTI